MYTHFYYKLCIFQLVINNFEFFENVIHEFDSHVNKDIEKLGDVGLETV